MPESPANEAWIEKPDGAHVPVAGNLALGRTPANHVVLADERVSRRHALIHAQGKGEFWLVDHGSRNGTCVNDRRVLQPFRLRDGDRIRIGPFQLTFRQPSAEATTQVAEPTSLHTLVDLHSAPCWLLVADVQGSSQLAQSVPPDELAMLMGGWFKSCQELVETNGGTLNKYLGDGFLAFWRARATPPSALTALLEGLRHLQRAGRPGFRFVLHHGEVLLGGGGTLGEDSLSGAAVNFVFRMEALARDLRQGCLVSDPAAEPLRGAIRLQPVGEHPVPSFEGRYAFFGL